MDHAQVENRVESGLDNTLPPRESRRCLQLQENEGRSGFSSTKLALILREILKQ
jgi:hypothetical protein